MGDLVSACVFCAGLLLGMDAPVWSGVSADVGVSYATVARSLDRTGTAGGHDLSDVTPKFLFVSAGGARAARDDLGAGTPEAEWRLRVALAPSHDEHALHLGVEQTLAQDSLPHHPRRTDDDDLHPERSRTSRAPRQGRRPSATRDMLPAQCGACSRP